MYILYTHGCVRAHIHLHVCAKNLKNDEKNLKKCIC